MRWLILNTALLVVAGLTVVWLTPFADLKPVQGWCLTFGLWTFATLAGWLGWAEKG